MTDENLTRRTALKTMAVGVAGVGLAGCSSSGGSDDGESDDSGGGSVNFDGWFDGVENHDGVTDETGADEVTVEVGTSGNGGNFGFTPTAVKVSTGTTVVWEWTGEGGSHNVLAEDGSFESELVGDEGHTFEHTFESTGTYKYVCEPHETMGMKGAVVVE